MNIIHGLGLVDIQCSVLQNVEKGAGRKLEQIPVVEKQSQDHTGLHLPEMEGVILSYFILKYHFFAVLSFSTSRTIFACTFCAK